MRELPALFSTPMVKALLENRKTMTRRTKGLEKVNDNPSLFKLFNNNSHYFHFETKPSISDTILESRYQVGDHIWVRELYYATGYWEYAGKTKTGKPKMIFHDTVFKELGDTYRYFDNPPEEVSTDRTKVNMSGWFKRSSLFMPKEAARIWLEVTGVRCERLHDISEADAIAEGIEKVQINQPFEGYKEYYIPGITMGIKPIDSFFSLWMSINGLESMQSNPWVFIYEFKRIEK